MTPFQRRVYFMAKSHWTEKEREQAEKEANRGTTGSGRHGNVSVGSKTTESASWTRKD